MIKSISFKEARNSKEQGNNDSFFKVITTGISFFERYVNLSTLRARAKITSHFDAPMHPAWLCCQSAEISRYSRASTPCQAGASTPENVNLFLREP